MNMQSPISANRAWSFQAALDAAAAWPRLSPIANDWIALDQEVPGDEDLSEEDADRHDEFLRAVLAMEAPSIETALAKQRLYLAMNGTPSASSLYAPLAIDPLATLIADLEKLATNPQRPDGALPAASLDPDAEEYRATKTTVGEMARMAPDSPALVGQEATPDPDSQFLEWEAEMDRLFAKGRASKSERVSETFNDAAMAIDHKIRTAPGVGTTAAIVKIRNLLHPEVGMFSAGDAATDETSLRTTLAALGVTPPPPHSEELATTEGDERISAQSAA